MTNDEYIDRMEAGGAPLAAETRAQVLAVMDRYGENRWWLSTQLRTIAYWQTHEPLTLVPVPAWLTGLEALIGRPVAPFELRCNRAGLRNEATNAYLGAQRSDPERMAAMAAADEALVTAIQGCRYRELRINGPDCWRRPPDA